ncbi:MAG: universal stress protein [Betaproteobacteria bacterium]|nr:universal stress protein [Betaproteobacteria bacterium]
MYQRILVPIDGSPTSDRGLKEAVRLAKEQRARLCLIHVIDQSVMPTLPSSGLYVRTVLEAMRRSGEIVLQHAMNAVKAEGVDADSRMVENFMGRVAEAIVDEAGKWRADLIVMGTHGRRGVSHLFLGSDAEMVVRMSDVPVLLVRAPATAEARQAAAA